MNDGSVSRPHDQVQEPSGRSEEEGQDQAGNDEKMAYPALGRIADFPASHEEIERKVVDPSRE